MTSVGAIDIGTNSVRLLVLADNGAELTRRMQITRLGQGVDASRCLAESAMLRTLDVLGEYAACLREHQCSALRMTATSAARDAENRELFFSRVNDVLGMQPELISGDEEARLSFLGATCDLDAATAPFLVFDIGGGSTEFALGTQRPEQYVSVDMGGVRMTERFLSTDPPTDEEFSAARVSINALLDRVVEKVDVGTAETWVGLAGTVTTFAASVLGLTRYEPDRTHGSVLTREQVRHVFRSLASVDVERRAQLIAEPKRAAVILGGAVILDSIMQRFQLQQIRVSEKDILDGLAMSLRGS